MKASLQAVCGTSLAVPQARPAQCRQQQTSWCHRRRPVVRSLQVPDEPAYDDIKLDDAFYKDLGIDEDEREAQKSYEPDDIDPMGVYEDDLESMADVNPDASPDLLAALSDATDVWGPKALLLAGLRLEEVAVTREIMDALGAAEVKVVPTTAAMLQMPLRMALETPEPNWEEPRAPDAAHGGGWGSQRVALFSGLSVKAVAAAVEVLEESGLPPLCVAMADEEDAQQPLGRVLAETVRDHRGRKNPSKQLWEDSPRVSDALPDLDTLIKEATSDRLQQFESAAKEGRLEEVLAEGAIEMTPEEVQQLKAREAADSAAAGVAGVMAVPQEAAAPVPQRQSVAPTDAAAADTMRAQQPAESAAAAGPSQAHPHNASTAPERLAGASSPVDGSHTVAAHSPSTGAESSVPNQRTPAQPSSIHSGLNAQDASPTNTSPAANVQQQSTSRQSMYQQPAGPQPPPGLLEREQFLSELRQRQQQEQQEADAGAEQEQQQLRQTDAVPAARSAGSANSQPNSDAHENFLAKYTFETLAMQREAQEAADVPAGPLGWQAELASVQSTGVTRTDVLEGRELQQRRRFRGSTGDFDTIDRIVEQPQAPKTDAAERVTTSSGPLDRDAIEAALRSGMDPAELKRLIDEAAAAVLPSAGGQEAMQPPRSAVPATASPWQQGPAVRRRGRPTISRKSPFEGANPRPRRQAEEASPAVAPMTREEIEAVARKLGKQPEAWLQDARDRGI